MLTECGPDFMWLLDGAFSDMVVSIVRTLLATPARAHARPEGDAAYTPAGPAKAGADVNRFRLAAATVGGRSRTFCPGCAVCADATRDRAPRPRGRGARW